MALLSRLGVFVVFNVFCIIFCQEENANDNAVTYKNKTRFLYDYQTGVVAFKDLLDFQCILEFLNNSESLIAKWVANGSKGNVTTVFLVSNQFLTRHQIKRVAGDRIVEFCTGLPTHVMIYPADDIQYAEGYAPDLSAYQDLQNFRRKRATRHYFQGRLRGQTQSQYLNFGKTDQPGKAEAESSFEGSKAVVSGTSGMGQAQSQSISLGCDECYGEGYSPGGYTQDQTTDVGRGRPSQITTGNGRIQTYPGDIQNGRKPDQFGTPGQTGGLDQVRRPGQEGFGEGGRPDQGGRTGTTGNGHNGRGPTQFGGGRVGGETGGRVGAETGGRVGGETGGRDGGGAVEGEGDGRGRERYPPTGGRPEQVGTGNGYTGRGPTQLTEDGRHQGEVDTGDRDRGEGIIGTGGGGRGQGRYPPTGQLPVGQPPRLNGQPPAQVPPESDQISGGPTQYPERPGGPQRIPNRFETPDRYPEGYGRPSQIPDQYGGPGVVPEGSTRPDQFGRGNGKIGGQGYIQPSRERLPSHVTDGPETAQFRPESGQVQTPGRPDYSGTIGLVDNVQRPTQHSGTFGGQLSGGYQGSSGYSGKFSGQFSGQYEGTGSPYVQPAAGSRLTGQGTNGYHTQGGPTAYQPTYDGLERVQSPPTDSRYTGPGQGQPGYSDQNRVTGTVEPGRGSQLPQYNGLDNGHGGPSRESQGGYQPVEPVRGSQGTSNGRLNGQYVTDQYGNRIQNGQSPQTGYQPTPVGNGQEIRQPGPGYGQEYKPEGYHRPSIGTNGQTDGSGAHLGPGYQPSYTDRLPPGGTQQPSFPSPYEHNGQHGTSGQNGQYENGGMTQYTNGLQGQGQQTGTSGTINQYGDGYHNGADITDQDQQGKTNLEGGYVEDDSDSQVQTSVQQMENGTHAKAQAQGTYAGGTADSEVSGTYTGSGSFSASAGSSDANRGAHTQVTGGKFGARSSAQGKGGSGRTQANVILSSETGDTVSNAQSMGINHGTQSEVEASEKGGLADAQANGPGSTSSQAQIGFTPYEENDDDNQTAPFRGGGTAGAQSGASSGVSQAQMHGKFLYGIRYNGGAQAESGSTGFGKNSSFRPGPFTPMDIPFYPKRSFENFTTNEITATQTADLSGDLTAAKDPVPEASEEEPEKHNPGDDEDKTDNTDDNTDDYSEGDYDTATELPSTRSIISQASRNQRQHIVLDPLEDLDITVHQSRGDFPEEGTVLQAGEIIPGSPGYKIPTGFRGTVKSISNGRNTYAIGRNSQAQSVTVSPGTGRIIYKRPVYEVSSNTHYRNGQYGYGSGYTYQPAYRPVQYMLKNGKVLPNFVSVTRSETGSQNVYTGQRTPRVYYSQSSSCGMFTSQCVLNNGRKLCFPKIKTNPDGTIMGC